MTATELAALFVEQMHAHHEGVPPPRPEPNAISVWEDLICNDPEQAWPVFAAVLQRVSDDETIEMVWFRLRLLLYRHYDRFYRRVLELLGQFKRLALVAGPQALDPSEYTTKPLDRDALIGAYRALHRIHDARYEVDRLAQTDPQRALTIAIEIIHRGVGRGWKTLDLMSPLQEVLSRNGPAVIDQVEELAKSSVGARRALWRLKRQMRLQTIDDDDILRQRGTAWVNMDLQSRLERAAGDTTDFTEQIGRAHV